MTKSALIGWDPRRMKKSMELKPREINSSLGKAVANRTIFRPGEKWGDVARRVAEGNASLVFLDSLVDKIQSPDQHYKEEFQTLNELIGSGIMLMSGRHLQHGDKTQPSRGQEVFTNCSTSSTSFLLFYLLLNGSGVGRSYDDTMMVTNWDNMPNIVLALSKDHPDYQDRWVDVKEAKELADIWFDVPDSREGWAQIVETIETMAFEGTHADKTLVIDFSQVRPYGAPIGGMQNRPASGPVPLMEALLNVFSVKGQGWAPWKQAMFVDHYLAECVLVGGARRAARIATKDWRDKDIFEYINIKEGGQLWSANNSVSVDESFWKQDTNKKQEILEAILKASYFHDTGEPGFINQHKLVQNDEGITDFTDGLYAQSKLYKPSVPAIKYLSKLAEKASESRYTQITNPCGEITLHKLGGFCVIGDLVPYHAPDYATLERAARAMVRALIRVNQMDSLYSRETKRTNRIGVGLTGIHEFAWNTFGYTFKDLLDENKSRDFWRVLSQLKRAIDDEAVSYATSLGLNTPHTNTTIKPAGTTSKLFALSEGAHLPAMREYVRWVQFRNDDPLVQRYRDMGYPTKELKNYKGTTVVGFPTQPEICKLGMGDNLITAGEATPEEQYKWLLLLEKYWIQGCGEDGQLLERDTGNQVSYTLKYKKDKVNFDQFKEMILKYQPQVRCCSVMPQVDMTVYEYQPEEPVSSGKFVALVEQIKNTETDEQIDIEHLKCESGACPI